ncbi:putative RNA methyltransferase [Jatrophihabitans fulvus]
MGGTGGAWDEVAPALRCPVCRSEVHVDARRLGCTDGHAFDLARQGYVNLLTGRGGPGTGDTAEMVAARDAVHAAGLLDPVVAAVAAAAVPDGLVLDLAGGSGQYLAAVLDRTGGVPGLVLDTSVPALRRAARCHPRAFAAGADAWGPLPLRDGVVALALSVFGPRRGPELARVLAPGAAVVVASPAPDHLAELVAPLGLVRVDPRKDERQDAALAPLTRHDREIVTYRRSLTRDEAAALAAMGPSAAHVADLSARVAALAERTDVGFAVRVDRYAR